LSQQEHPKKGLIQRLHGEFGFITGNFAIMIASWLILDFCTELPATYYPLYVKALGGTAATLGLINAVGSIAGGLVQIPGGYIADKYGRRWIITTMTFTSAFSRLLYIFAPSWEWLLVGAILSGVTNIYGPALNAIVADSVPKEKRGMAFTVQMLIMSVSTTPAPLISGYLLTVTGLIPSMRLSYGVAFLGFLAAALMRTRIKETVENPSKIDLREVASSIPMSLRGSISVWRELPRAALTLFVVDVIMGFSINIILPVLAFYIIDDLHIGEVNYSYLMTILFVTMIAVSLPSGKIIDMIGKRKPLIAAYILWMIAVPLFIWGNFTRIVVAMTLIGLLQVLMSGAGSALYADLVPKEHRGKVNGARGFYIMIAGSIGQIAGGWLYDNVSHSLPFILQLPLIIVPFTLLLLYVKEPEKTIN
jgi:MFS family permease